MNIGVPDAAVLFRDDEDEMEENFYGFGEVAADIPDSQWANIDGMLLPLPAFEPWYWTNRSRRERERPWITSCCSMMSCQTFVTVLMYRSKNFMKSSEQLHFEIEFSCIFIPATLYMSR